MGDIDIAVVDSLKVLDPRRPIREADMWAVFLAIASCHDSRCAMFEPRDVRPEALRESYMRRREFIALSVVPRQRVRWRCARNKRQCQWSGFFGPVRPS